jgi:hypothetical protein
MFTFTRIFVVKGPKYEQMKLKIKTAKRKDIARKKEKLEEYKEII